MYREPWLERKYWIMMAKWAIVWTILTGATVCSVGFFDTEKHARKVAEIFAYSAVVCLVVMFIRALTRLTWPRLFRSPRKSPDTMYLRTAGLVVGCVVGAALGVSILPLLE